MRKSALFVAAFVLTLGLAQCKKEQPATPQSEGNVVTITLNVGDSNGSRVNVNPTGTDQVTFTDGDTILVANGGKYVGALGRADGVFSGNITNPVEGQKLYFYFLGNKADVSQLTAGSSTTCTVNISDQTGYPNLPVISMGKSTVNYSSDVTSYSSRLYNKCSLMKFNVTTTSTAAICITGMNNTVTVNFANPTDEGFEYGKDGEGVIKMHGVTTENTETWAIVLPQAALEEGAEGSVYTYDNAYIGIRPAMGEIVMNTYSNSGFALEVTTPAAPVHEYVDLGLPSGLLWATCNVGANAPEEYGDYFAWGETQPKDTYNWSTYQYCHGSDNTLTKYCNNSNYGYNGFIDNLTTLLPEDDAATANWRSGWRMPTETEWLELYQHTTNIWTTQNGVNGRLFTASNGNSLFLPAAGYLDQDSLKEDGSWSYHWSSSLFMAYSVYARGFHFSSSYSNTGSAARYYGRPVRAVRSGSQN